MRAAFRAAVVMLALQAAPAAAQQQEDLIWGVTGHPLVSYPGVSIDDQILRVWELGMRSYRVDVTSMAQADKLAELIAKGRERNVDILPVLVPTLDMDKMEPEALYRAAFEFASFFVKRFRNDIRVWELGNELETYAIIRPCEMQHDGKQYSCGWGPAGGGTPLEYYGPRWRKVSGVLKGMSDATKAIDPTARRAIGTAGWGRYGAYERMRQDGIEWDITVWHTFSPDLESQLLRVASYGKPIWITEFNHPKGSHDSAVAQAAGLEKMMIELRALRQRFKIEAAHVYELLDETYWAPHYEGSMGLVYLAKDEGNNTWHDDGAKPAHCTVRTMIKGGWRMGDKSRPPQKQVWFPAPTPTRSCNLCALDPRDAAPETGVRYASCLALGRQLEGNMLASWSARLRKGELTPDQMLEQMILTRVKEIESVRGGEMTNQAFVTFLYRLLLDHDPDGHGLGQYTAAIDDGRATRAQTVRNMLNHGIVRWLHSGLYRTVN
jgi:hypothetical protein